MQDLARLIPPLLPLGLILMALALPLLQLLSPQRPTAMPRETAFPAATLGLFLAILAFLTMLFSFWASGRSHPNLIGGLLPWSDATSYFLGANALLDSGDLNGWSQRRPVYTSLFAGFLALGDRDLQIALLLQSVFAGAVAFFIARVAMPRMGMAAGIFVFAILFAFASEHTPLTMSENAGFLFGGLAVALLWLGIEKPRASWFAAAGFLLMTGLLARAGAFLVIPFLLLWTLTAFWKERRTAIWCTLALLGGVLLAILLNQTIYWYAGDGTNITNANFSYSFYGLAAGGKGWQQIYVDHPGIFPNSEGIIAKKIFALAFERIVQNPLDFVIGYLKSLPHFGWVLFGFVPSFLTVQKPLAIFFSFFWLAGLWVAFRSRQKPHALFLLAATTGTVLSAPFLADAGSRLFAATIPFDALVIGLGFSTIATWLMRKFKRKLPMPAMAAGLSAQILGTAVLLIGLTLAGTFFFPGMGNKASPSLTCNRTEMPIVLRLGDEAPLVALRSTPPFTAFPPQVPHPDFLALLRREVHLRDKLKLLPPETALIAGYGRNAAGESTLSWVAWETENLPVRGSHVGFCLKAKPHPLLGSPFHEPASVRLFGQGQDKNN